MQLRRNVLASIGIGCAGGGVGRHRRVRDRCSSAYSADQPMSTIIPVQGQRWWILFRGVGVSE